MGGLLVHDFDLSNRRNSSENASMFLDLVSEPIGKDTKHLKEPINCFMTGSCSGLGDVLPHGYPNFLFGSYFEITNITIVRLNLLPKQ